MTGSQHTLEQQISDYREWRSQLARAVSDYRDWLEASGEGDALQDLRLYDMMQALHNDRLVLAFVAEFARGKTETINALFFSDFKARLLPCDAGRTTMCPMEIFWDAREEPCIRLLPIETRKRDEGLALLRMTPQAWTRLRLDTGSAESMQEALRFIVQRKEVPPEEARALGLWDERDQAMVQAAQARGTVEVPVWRHALINYPHPLLKDGLVILDTPGLNALGTEPELTVSIIPNAHAVVFLLATDTGVTRSDMEVWTRFIRDRAARKLAVLNKIDILWDDLKSREEIDAMIRAQVAATAHQLGLPANDVFAISAQKALVARVRNDTALLARSGIERLERTLTENVIAAKQAILGKSVVSEVAAMVKVSRRNLQQRLVALRDQRQELESLRGRNAGAVQELLNQVSRNRKHYEASLATFNEGQQRLAEAGEALMKRLSLSRLEHLLEDSRHRMGASWTTHGLNQGMKALIRDASGMAGQVARAAEDLADMGERLYLLFHTQHGFELHKPAPLDLADFHQALLGLQEQVDAFCADPINIATEKHFLVRKFFFTLAAEVQREFEQARNTAGTWLKGLLAPLKLQITQHKAQLEQRARALMAVHKDMSSLQQNLERLRGQLAALQEGAARLDRMLLTLIKASRDAAAATPPAPPVTAGAPVLTEL